MPLPSEIVLLLFPFTDLSATKRRPVLVLKEGNAQGDFLAVQTTSQMRYRPVLSLITEDFEPGGGLPKESDESQVRLPNSGLGDPGCHPSPTARPGHSAMPKCA
ncbi:MAG: hypothetical protein U9Q81_21295 [Pseudomonadota bacterium]|nr:hypothetical protein [Pseudomonadota bacterium]